MPKMIDEFDIQLYLFLLADTADLGTIWGVQGGISVLLLCSLFYLTSIIKSHFVSILSRMKRPSRVESNKKWL